MVCPKCYGCGEDVHAPTSYFVPCPECQGSGIVSCCDTAGASEQYMKPEDYWADVEKALPSAVSK
jgi:DnaJ-class molecular chaperone